MTNTEKDSCFEWHLETCCGHYKLEDRTHCIKYVLSNRNYYFCILVSFQGKRVKLFLSLPHVFPLGQDFKLVTYLTADQIMSCWNAPTLVIKNELKSVIQEGVWWVWYQTRGLSSEEKKGEWAQPVRWDLSQPFNHILSLNPLPQHTHSNTHKFYYQSSTFKQHSKIYLSMTGHILEFLTQAIQLLYSLITIVRSPEETFTCSNNVFSCRI